MAKARDYVFILWADRFDEAAAAIFVTEFRKAGLRVKLVGLGGPLPFGAHGLALLPDLTLDEIVPLAGQTSCVVVPCDSPSVQRLRNDPRLVDFVDQAGDGDALFIVGPAATGVLGDAEQSVGRHVVYPAGQDMIPFAQQVANRLSLAGRPVQGTGLSSLVYQRAGL